LIVKARQHKFTGNKILAKDHKIINVWMGSSLELTPF